MHTDTQNQWWKALITGSVGKGSILRFLLAGNSTIIYIEDTASDLQYPLAEVHRSFLLAWKITTEILIWSGNTAGTHQEHAQLTAVGPKELAWLQLWLSGKEGHHWGAESTPMQKDVKKPCATYLETSPDAS